MRFVTHRVASFGGSTFSSHLGDWAGCTVPLAGCGAPPSGITFRSVVVSTRLGPYQIISPLGAGGMWLPIDIRYECGYSREECRHETKKNASPCSREPWTC